MRILNKINCWLGWHDLSSYGEMLNYDFSSLPIKKLNTDDNLRLFDELTTLRCKHCNYTYKGTKLTDIKKPS